MSLLGPVALERALANTVAAAPFLRDKEGRFESGFTAGFIAAAKIAQDEARRQGITLK